MENSVLEQLRFATVIDMNEGYQLALDDPLSLSVNQSISAALHMIFIQSLHEFDRSPFVVNGNYALQPRGVLHFCAVLLNPRNEAYLRSYQRFTYHHTETLLPGKRDKMAQVISELFEGLLRQIVRRSFDQRALAADLRQMATLAINFGDSDVLRRCIILCQGYNGVLAREESWQRSSHHYYTFQFLHERSMPGWRQDVLGSRPFADTISVIMLEGINLRYVCLRYGVASYHSTCDVCQSSQGVRFGPNQMYSPDLPASSWNGSSFPSIASGTTRGQTARRADFETQRSQEAPVNRMRFGPPFAAGNYTPSRFHDNLVCIRCGTVSHGLSDACRCSSGDQHDSPDLPFGPDRRGRGESFRVATISSRSFHIASTLAASSTTGRNGVPTRHIDDRKMFSCAAVRVPSEFVRSSLFFARTHTVLTFETSVDENARRETYRLSSFEPFQFNAAPLARSGFFHLGFTDAVRCFSCHVVVADWQNSRLGLSRWHLASCLHNRNLPTANRSIESFMSPSRPMTQRPCQRCLRLRATVAFQPCGHLCFCSRCAGAPDIPTRCPRCGIAVSRPAFKP